MVCGTNTWETKGRDVSVSERERKNQMTTQREMLMLRAGERGGRWSAPLERATEFEFAEVVQA